ncbi:hypothetical protein Bca52824_023534 [Brassica carinata]|uniref:Uncharacterized protein n=1 Tax=Brassica carinata TaxID=52824 RepID=A0A8X8AUJ1_BRACI|nr:hypothetical protein Bca52824_023534 [Brassica carinata]
MPAVSPATLDGLPGAGRHSPGAGRTLTLAGLRLYSPGAGRHRTLASPDWRHSTLLGAEIKVPVKNKHAYAFSEHGKDLGSCKDVKGNPTAVYMRMGQGSSCGVGVKLGLVRAEYAIDHNNGTGVLFFSVWREVFDILHIYMFLAIISCAF